MKQSLSIQTGQIQRDHHFQPVHRCHHVIEPRSNDVVLEGLKFNILHIFKFTPFFWGSIRLNNFDDCSFKIDILEFAQLSMSLMLMPPILA